MHAEDLLALSDVLTSDERRALLRESGLAGLGGLHAGAGGALRHRQLLRAALEAQLQSSPGRGNIRSYFKAQGRRKAGIQGGDPCILRQALLHACGKCVIRLAPNEKSRGPREQSRESAWACVPLMMLDSVLNSVRADARCCQSPFLVLRTSLPAVRFCQPSCVRLREPFLQLLRKVETLFYMQDARCVQCMILQRARLRGRGKCSSPSHRLSFKIEPHASESHSKSYPSARAGSTRPTKCSCCSAWGGCASCRTPPHRARSSPPLPSLRSTWTRGGDSSARQDSDFGVIQCPALRLAHLDLVCSSQCTVYFSLGSLDKDLRSRLGRPLPKFSLFYIRGASKTWGKSQWALSQPRNSTRFAPCTIPDDPSPSCEVSANGG